MSIIEKALDKSSARVPSSRRPAPARPAAPEPPDGARSPSTESQASRDDATAPLAPPTLADLGLEDLEHPPAAHVDAVGLRAERAPGRGAPAEELDDTVRTLPRTALLPASAEPAVRAAPADPMAGFNDAGAGAEAGVAPRSERPPPGAAGARVTVDVSRLARSGFITPDNLESTTAEEFRIVKRHLLRRAAQRESEADAFNNLVLVTSSVPGEGKTYVSINLAVSIAMEVDRTVLLVDTDVAKSDVARTLGFKYKEGLTDYLRNDDKDLSRFLIETDVPNLVILPVGKSYANATELFSSQGMVRLRDELAHRYRDRIVVFDSAPLLAASGTSVLAELVGQVVMVVEAVRTSRGALREALRVLETVPQDRIGMILNKSREIGRRSYHYGYYGSGQRVEG